jgi:hypothetical protein
MSTSNLKAGAVVVLGDALGGAITYSYAMVLTVSSYPGEGAAPELSLLLIPDPDNPQLTKANWQLGVQRITDVAHVSHPQVKSGARPQFWVTILPDAGSTPELGAVAADEVPLAPVGTSSVLDRQVPANYRVPGELSNVASPIRAVEEIPPAEPVDLTPAQPIVFEPGPAKVSKTGRIASETETPAAPPAASKAIKNPDGSYSAEPAGHPI